MQRFWIQALALALSAVAAAPALADSLSVADGNNEFQVPVTNWKRVRQHNMLIQQYDFSCGSAALAALLTFHYHRPKTEQEVFQAMYAVGDQARIRQVGFSLLDMKTYLETIGLRADGFEVSLATLARLKIPAITLIEVNGYKHFVIVKGIEGERVLLGDPARGITAMSQKDFAALWNGIAFIIRNDAETARNSFNDAKDWSAQPKAPMGNALNEQSLTSFTLNLR